MCYIQRDYERLKRGLKRDNMFWYFVVRFLDCHGCQGQLS